MPEPIEGFDLAILFTAAGALVGAGLVKIIVSALKNVGLLPEHGRGVMYAAFAISAGLVALALIDLPLLRDGVSGQDVLLVVLAVVNIYAASVGIHESTKKVGAVVQARTNPTGPDPEAP